MITTIIFDLSEVYLKGLIGVEHHLEPILKMSPNKIYPKLTGENFNQLMNGKISEEEYWQKIIKNKGFDIEVEHFKSAIRANFEEIGGTREIIEKLKLGEFKLGLLSVHAKEWVDYCEEKFDYHKLFHSTMYSFEVGISKPDKKAYELILEKLKVKPEECLFIDDKEKNIIAAEELGIKTIHFKGSNQLKKELLDKFNINLT